MTGLVLGWEAAEASRRLIGFGVAERHDTSAGHPQLVTDEGESHTLVLAATGAGKGRSLAIPNLLSWDGPAIVVDVKGELSAVTAGYRESIGQTIIRLNPWRVNGTASSAFNPMSILIGAGDDLADRAYMLASALREPEEGGNDKFWRERAETLIAGIMAHLATEPKEEDKSLARVWSLLNGDDAVYALAQMLDAATNLDPFALKAIGSFLNTVEVTRSGILSTAQSMMRVFASEAVRKAVSGSDVILEAVRSGAPLTIYLTVPVSRIASHAALLRCWLAALMTTLTERQTRPEKSTLLVLDELAQLGPMPQVRTAVTLARGYGVRAMLFLQSYAQLKLLYRDHVSLLENCGTIATFGHTSRSMSVQLAEALGDVSPDQLYQMRRDELAVKQSGQDTRILRKIDYLRDAPYAGRAAPNPLFEGRRAS